MQQTTFGAIPKTKVIENLDLQSILKKELECFKSVSSESTVYQNGIVISDPGLNYLNSITEVNSLRTVRSLIESEYLNCEKFCPGTGNVFLSIFFDYFEKNKLMFLNDHNDQKAFDEKVIDQLKRDYSQVLKNNTRVNKENLVRFINRFKNEKAKNDFCEVLNQSKISTTAFIEESNFTETKIRKIDNCSFRVKFDTDFLLGSKSKTIKDFNFIIIDGFIDKISEIHHLLTKASESEEEYVIFCKGMREDVKYTIYQNLLRRTIKVFPISLETNELNINVLVDVAACLDSDVLSHLSGINISTAVRRDLKKGKKIVIDQNGFTIESMNENRMRKHLNHLRERIIETEFEGNKELLRERIKFVTSDRLEIKIPKKNDDKKYTQDLMHLLSQFKFCHSGIVEEGKFKFFPSKILLYAIKKSESLLKIIYNTQQCVIFENKT